MAQDIGTLQEKGAAREAVAKGILGDKIDSAFNADERAIQVLQEAHDKESPLAELITSPVSNASIEEAKDKSIGWSWQEIKDVDGKVTGITKVKERTIESQNHLTEAEGYIKFVQDFLKLGYAELPGVPNTLDRDEYREKVLGIVIKIWPEAKEALKDMSPTDQRKAMDNILRTPLFAEKMKEAMEKAVEFGKQPKEMDPELKRRKTEAELELQRLVDRRKTLKDRTVTVGELYVPPSIKDLIDSNADLNVEAQRVIREMARLNGEIVKLNGKARLERDRAANLKKPDESADKITALERAGQYEEQAAEREASVQALKNQGEDIERYQRNSTSTGKVEYESQDKIDELEHQIRIAETRLLGIQADYNLAEEHVKGHEEAFVSKLKGAPENALRGYLDEMTKRYEGIRDTEIRKNGDDQLAKGLEDRWNFKGIGGKKAGELNKVAVRQDYKDLIANGPDDVVIRTLVAGGMRQEEAVAKMDSDEGFAKRARQDVVERLLSRQLQSGNVTTSEAQRILENKTWGGPELIRRAIENRTNALGSSEVEALKAAGVGSSEFVEKLKGLPLAKLAKLLLLILILGGLSLNVLGSFGLLTAAVGKVGAVAAGAFHGATGAVSGAFSGVTGAVGGGLESAQHAISGGADTAGNVASSSTEAATNAASGSADAVTNVVSGSTGAISQGVPPGVINSAVVSGVDLGSNVVSIAADAAPGVVEGVTTGVTDYGPIVIDKVSNASAGDIARVGAVSFGAVGLAKYAGGKNSKGGH